MFVSLLLIAGGVLAAEGPEGQWTWSMPGPGGADVQADLVMKIEGDKLTGEFAFNGGSRKLEIVNGSVKGNEVKFTIKRSRPQGGDMVYEMKGTVSGDQMKGSAASDMGNAEWTAKRKS
jgi:hypothetical protein